MLFLYVMYEWRLTAEQRHGADCLPRRSHFWYKSNVTTQVDRLKVFRLKAVRGQSCVTTQNFRHLSWLMVLAQVDRLKSEGF